MGWWKADPAPEPPTKPALSQAPPIPPPPTNRPSPSPSPSSSTTSSPSACPVDEKSRQVWLTAAQSSSQASGLSQRFEPPPSHPPIQSQSKQPTLLPPTPQPTTLSRDCSSDRISQSPTHPPPTINTPRPLSLSREVSTIPRSFTDTQTRSTIPSNAESETGSHPSGNWIYPSESQFYHAVMSKNTLTTSSPDTLLSSISSIIPIHNAVNERAWHLIKEWEGSTSSSCGGPKLHSFAGSGAGALTPKAKWNTWVMGSQEPFDRHDWVVERCGGERVEYVIDFYQGKKSEADKAAGREGGNLNFYLDVRPKLNSLAGWQMRAERILGWR